MDDDGKKCSAASSGRKHEIEDVSECEKNNQSASTSGRPLVNEPQSYEAYGARPKIRAARVNQSSNSKQSTCTDCKQSDVPSVDIAVDDGTSAASQTDCLGRYREISSSSRSLEDDSSSQEETVETVEERMRQQSRPTCTTSKNSIIVHTNYFPKHMLPHNLGNNRLSGDMSVFDSPDDNLSNVVDFIEADIARVYLQGSNSSRGSSTGDLCETTSNVSSLPHENISGLAQSDNETDLREKDRPSTEEGHVNHCDNKEAEGGALPDVTPETPPTRNPSLHLQKPNHVLVPNSHASNVENKADIDYLDLDLDVEAQYSPEYLQSNSSESNFQYGMMDERSLSVELGYNTDSFSDGIGPLGGDSTKSGDKTDSETNSDEFPFSDGYGTIKARDSSNKSKNANRNDTDVASHNNIRESNGWESEQSRDLNMSRQTDQSEDLYNGARETANRNQEESSVQEQEPDYGYKLVCMVDPVKKSNKKTSSRDKRVSNTVNMDNDPILNANRTSQNNPQLGLDDRHLYLPEIRQPRSLIVNRERRAASLEDSDIMGSCHRKNNTEHRKEGCKSRSHDHRTNGERLTNNGAPHMPCYSLPLLPQELDSIRRGMNMDDGHAGLEFKDGLADLHLASQEQWDEYMALTRSLSASRPRNNVSVVRPLSPTLPSTSSCTSREVSKRSRDDGSKNVDTCTDLLILHLMREREHKGKLQDDNSSASGAKMDKVMIWSEYEAYLLQVKQIGTSACGATAVINILKALNIYVDKDAVCGAIKTNLRAETAPLPQYLLSRSIAGTTAHDLLEGIQTLTHGKIKGRFFDLYPRRAVDIREWMAQWIRKGAVPLLTLNLQQAVPVDWQIPDAWHHQMAYGVSNKGVYLTNPLELVPCNVLNDQLCSESVLLVRRQDILSRWSDSCDLSLLLSHDDPRWTHMNVIGQVVNIMREQHMPKATGYRPNRTSHVKIPAVYRSGISLFAKTDSDVYKELLQAPELPPRKERFMETAV